MNNARTHHRNFVAEIKRHGSKAQAMVNGTKFVAPLNTQGDDGQRLPPQMQPHVSNWKGKSK